MATSTWVLMSQRIWTDSIRRRIFTARTLCDIAERRTQWNGAEETRITAAETRTTIAKVRRNLAFARVQLHKPAYLAQETASEFEELCSQVEERIKHIEASLVLGE